MTLIWGYKIEMCAPAHHCGPELSGLCWCVLGWEG